MKKVSKKWLLILLAVAMTVFPMATAFALEEVEITENAPLEVGEAPVIEAPVSIEEAVAEEVQEPQQEEIVSTTENQGVTEFVTRMYTVCLNRQPDEQGLQAWSNLLLNGKSTGADIAYGFIFSPEFLAKNLSNEDYLKALYAAFFGREADSTGLLGWSKVLEEGYSRMYVLSGFVNSQEFTKLCESYGIQRGELKLSPADQTPSIAVFVERLYKLCLLRNADTEGLNSWTAALKSKQTTGAQVAYGFVFSPEFLNRNVSDEEYVNIMYKTFFNRDADAQGKQSWLKVLKEGTHRQNVLAGFTNSVEFGELCKKYDVERGTLATTTEPQPKPPAPLIDPRQEHYIFEETATEVKITGYKNGSPREDAFNIPAYINGKPVTVIGKRTFFNTRSVTGDLIIPDTVITIEDEAFANYGNFNASSNFDKFVIGKNVKHIGKSAFASNTAIGVYNNFEGDLIIPASVEYIGDGAFSGSSKLKSAEFLGDKPTMEELIFYYRQGNNSDFKVYYPKNAKGWPAPESEVGKFPQIAK